MQSPSRERPDPNVTQTEQLAPLLALYLEQVGAMFQTDLCKN